MVAYTLFALAILHAVDAVRSRAGSAAANGAVLLAVAMTLQAALGIQTLLHQVPILLGLAHQAMAIVVLTLAILQAERLAARQPYQVQHISRLAGRPERAELNDSNFLLVSRIPYLQRFPALRWCADEVVWGSAALLAACGG